MGASALFLALARARGCPVEPVVEFRRCSDADHVSDGNGSPHLLDDRATVMASPSNGSDVLHAQWLRCLDLPSGFLWLQPDS